MSRRTLRRSIVSAAIVGAAGVSSFVAAPSQAESLKATVLEATTDDPNPDGPIWWCVSVDGREYGQDEYYYCQRNPLPDRLPLPNMPSLPAAP